MKKNEIIEKKNALLEQVFDPHEAEWSLEKVFRIKSMVYIGLEEGAPNDLSGCLRMLDELQELFILLSFLKHHDDFEFETSKKKTNAQV